MVNKTYKRKSIVQKLVAVVALIAVILSPVKLSAEPWVDTREPWLRADIEYLAGVGLIQVPINTWPLMWSGILNDLERADLQGHSQRAVNSHARLMAAGSRAARVNRPQQSLQLAAASDSQLLRHFGDSARDKGQLTLRRHGLTRNFAYNVEVSEVNSPWDGESAHFDNSYLAAVWGNWILAVGNIQRWWGPNWSSSLILSNNARPTASVMLQRNYSEASALPILNYLGPWTFSAFASELDDKRHISGAKLLGMSLGFKPRTDLEINLRRTAQWGGEGRPESFDNLIKLLTGGADNCDTPECRDTEPGNQLGAIDFSWQMPILEATLYGQHLGEDEAGYMPSRSSQQWGVKRPIAVLGTSGSLFLEFDNTTTVTHEQRYNILYNHSIYQTGYRYRGRAIGATWDNDSKVTSVGFVGQLDNGDQLDICYSHGEINSDSLNGSPSKHSITTTGAKFSRLSTKWRRSFPWGQVQLDARYMDTVFDEYGRQSEKFSLSASLNYALF